MPREGIFVVPRRFGREQIDKVINIFGFLKLKMEREREGRKKERERERKRRREREREERKRERRRKKRKVLSATQKDCELVIILREPLFTQKIYFSCNT